MTDLLIVLFSVNWHNVDTTPIEKINKILLSERVILNVIIVVNELTIVIFVISF